MGKWVGRCSSKGAYAKLLHQYHTSLLEGFVESHSMPIWLCVN